MYAVVLKLLFTGTNWSHLNKTSPDKCPHTFGHIMYIGNKNPACAERQAHCLIWKQALVIHQLSLSEDFVLVSYCQRFRKCFPPDWQLWE